jgi:hypothetical protein
MPDSPKRPASSLRSRAGASATLAAFLVALACLFPGSAWAARATVRWDLGASTTIAGYRVHYGTTSGAYAVHVDAGNADSLAIVGLYPGTTYHFAVTAYDVFGGESGYSADIPYTTAADPETIAEPSAPAGPAAGVTATAYPFTASGAVSSAGDPVRYRFHWGDGTVSDWIATEPATAWKSWDAAGVYPVQAEAACAVHPSVNAFSAVTAVDVRQPDSLLFSDDFADGGPGGDPDWAPVGAAWAVRGAGLHLVSPAKGSGAYLIRSLPAFATGRLQSTFRFAGAAAETRSAGVVFAYRDGRTYRYVRVFGTKVVIGQVGPTPAEPGGKKRVARLRLKSGAWHRVDVDLHPDGSVLVFLDGSGEPAAAYRFADVVAGGVGYLTHQARTYYDDCFVWDDTVLP